MVRGTARAIVGAASAVARTAITAAPLVGRPEPAADTDEVDEVDVSDEVAPEAPPAVLDPAATDPTAGTVTPIVPTQPASPDHEQVPGPDDDPDLDPAARLTSTAAAEDLVVRPDEEPWTEAEVAEVHDELSRRAAQLRAEVAELDAGLQGLIRAPGEGTGHDSADVGSASSERDHEISLGNNARLMLHQTERALERLATGSFGVCEECGGAIGKMRVMAFPRATLCMSCKQREERR